MTVTCSVFPANAVQQDAELLMLPVPLHFSDREHRILHKGLRSGTFAEMIRHMMLLPEDERAAYCIEKAGDREYHAAEVAQLAALPDFPHA